MRKPNGASACAIAFSIALVALCHASDGSEDSFDGWDDDDWVDYPLEFDGDFANLESEARDLEDNTIDGMAGDGDFVVCLGAGSISAWANALPDQLEQLRAKAREAANDGR